MTGRRSIRRGEQLAWALGLALTFSPAAPAMDRLADAPTKLDAQAEKLLADADLLLLVVPGPKQGELVSAKVTEQLLAPLGLGNLVGDGVLIGAEKAGAQGLAALAAAKGPQLVYGAVGSIGHQVTLLYLGHTAPPAAAGLKDLGLQARSRWLRQRLHDAALVVQATVSAVAAASADDDWSEHDADWAQATLTIKDPKDVLKAGKGSPPSTVTVRVPTSNDISWSDRPRVHKGQEAVFVLSAAGASLYELVEPIDLRPASERPLVTKLLQLAH
jgi:hypothetical protein